MDCELIESGDDVFDQPEGWFSFPYSQFIETVDDPRDLIVNSQAIGNAENQVGGCFQPEDDPPGDVIRIQGWINTGDEGYPAVEFVDHDIIRIADGAIDIKTEEFHTMNINCHL